MLPPANFQDSRFKIISTLRSSHLSFYYWTYLCFGCSESLSICKAVALSCSAKYLLRKETFSKCQSKCLLTFSQMPAPRERGIIWHVFGAWPVFHRLSSYSRLCRPSRPIPLKSVFGSLPWKPISHHCLEMRPLRGVSGRSSFHSWERKMEKNL